MTEEWLIRLGAVVLALALVAGYHSNKAELQGPGALAFYLGSHGAIYTVMAWAMGWELMLGFMGLGGVVMIIGYLGRATINQAYVDIGPERSAAHRTCYRLIQITVVGAAFWAYGMFIDSLS